MQVKERSVTSALSLQQEKMMPRIIIAIVTAMLMALVSTGCESEKPQQQPLAEIKPQTSQNEEVTKLKGIIAQQEVRISKLERALHNEMSQERLIVDDKECRDAADPTFQYKDWHKAFENFAFCIFATRDLRRKELLKEGLISRDL